MDVEAARFKSDESVPDYKARLVLIEMPPTHRVPTC